MYTELSAVGFAVSQQLIGGLAHVGLGELKDKTASQCKSSSQSLQGSLWYV